MTKDMNNDNHVISRVGKQLPYRVPDRFFDNIDDEIISYCMKNRQSDSEFSRTKLLRSLACAGAAAACVCAVIGSAYFLSGQRQEVSVTDIENAFAELSDIDRDYILTTYNEDYFFNY